MLNSLSSAIQRGCQFLEKMQWEAGFWIDFELAVGMSSQWVTAYIAHCLAAVNPDSPAPARAAAWLLQTQLAEGGWGFNRHVPPDADSIANVLLLLTTFQDRLISAEDLFAIAQTLLAFQSTSDGGFATYLPRPKTPLKAASRFIYSGSGWCASHLSVTALSACALASLDQAYYGANLRNAVQFVRLSQHPDGYWEDHWWNDHLYGTYWAARFLLLMEDDTAFQKVSAWVQNCAKTAWGKDSGVPASAFHSALALATLTLKPPSPAILTLTQQGVARLLESQLPDGSWQSVPVLLTPIPRIQKPWLSRHPSARQASADQNRQFTTATVLLALAQFKSALRSSSPLE